MKFSLTALALVVFTPIVAAAQVVPEPYQTVLTTLGKSGDFKDDVLKVNIPRGDVTVTIAGRPAPTPFGFGGWVAFAKGDDDMDVMMGDLVLTEDEVNPVMSAILANGLQVTALHNHFFWDQPRMFYMHVHGHGTAAAIAKQLRPAVDLINGFGAKRPTPVAAATPAAATPALDTAALAKIIGAAGDQNGAVYKITIGRPDIEMREHGALVNSRMGLNTWAAFTGRDADAMVAGDVAMLEHEVTPVLAALRANGLDIVAIHHHMTDTRPVVIDAARAGDRIDVEAGTYAGDLFIHTSVHLVGHGRPRLVGSGNGSVIRVRADHVTIEGFAIDGRLGGNLARDTSGIHVAAKHVVIRDCTIVRSLFGIYLREADDARVDGCEITGIEGRLPGEQGSGVHVWNTQRFTLENIRVRFSRDGFYIQSSHHGVITGNEVRDVRYGLHYMNSNDNRFEDNTFAHGAAGAALMYSRRVSFARNRFLHNRGFASVGLLLKDCEDVVAEDNLVADNERGFFIDGAVRHVFRRNLVAASDVAVVVYASSQGSRFEDNTFVGNLAPLRLVGRRTDTVFDGNYWSEFDEPDLDGDGVRDRPYRLSNVFDHLRGNLVAADLFAQGIGARVLARAETTFPVLRQIDVSDARPLRYAPGRGAIPAMPEPDRATTLAGLAVSALGVIAGLAVFHVGRRR